MTNPTAPFVAAGAAAPAAQLFRELSAPAPWSDASRDTYQAILTAESRWRGLPGGIYGVFQEMEDKDAHYFATLQTRRTAVAACEWKIVPGGDGVDALAAAREVEHVLRAVPGLHDTFYHLLDALAKGFAVAEILYEQGADGVTISAIKPRGVAHFAFGRDGHLHLLTEDAPQPWPLRSAEWLDTGEARDRLLPRPGEWAVLARAARRLPARKMLVFVAQPAGGTPYGSPLAGRAFWYVWFKRNNVKFWTLYNERFGAPTAVARYGSTTTPEELEQLADVVRNLQSDTGVLIPDSIALEYLEARRGSPSSTFRDLADWCNDEISKVVLGQTLTTTDGRRSGSYAQARVHDSVRQQYLASDARALGEMLTAQLVRWIADFRLGPGAPLPRLVFDYADPEEFGRALEVDEHLVRMGVRLPAAYFYDRYRRPSPREGERVLRFDDTNLYQYHLQFGVLTINEVRESLGLGPVPWGHQPTTAFPGVAREQTPTGAPPRPPVRGTLAAGDRGEESEDDPEEQRADRRTR